MQFESGATKQNGWMLAPIHLSEVYLQYSLNCVKIKHYPLFKKVLTEVGVCGQDSMFIEYQVIFAKS